MKTAKQIDENWVTDGVPTKTSNDWQDDDISSVASAEENWCLVSSDDDVQQGENKKNIPKGNCWWDEDEPAAEEETSFVDKLKDMELYEKLPPSLQNPKNLLLLLHLMLGLFIVIHLAYDRYSWRRNAIQLEEELRILKPTSPPITLSVPPAGINEEEPRLNFEEDFIEWHEEKQSDVIFDNCWIYAKGSVSLRECAEDAKDTVQEVAAEVVKTAKTFAKHTWKATKKFQKHLTAAVAAEAARRRNQPY